MKPIKVTLPGGRVLLACEKDDHNYPGINIKIIEPDDESDGRGDVVAVVEYAPVTPGNQGAGIYIRAYTRDDDEPYYSMPYSLERSDFEQVFSAHRVTDIVSRQTIHIEWGDLGVILSNLLTRLLHREIEVEALLNEYYDWCACLSPHISKEEFELLIRAADADELYRVQKDFGEFPAMELRQGLCNKLMSKLLPFKVGYSRTNDEGVWFISQ